MSIFRITELERRLANVIRSGVVVDVNYQTAKCRVAFGNILTEELPFFASSAGGTKSWSPPSVGETVVVFSPSGEINIGFVLCGIYTNANPANSNSPSKTKTTFSDGNSIEYDTATHTLTVVSGSNVTVNCPQVNLNGSVSVSGSVTVSGDVTAGGISLKTHKHGGVKAGGDQSGTPV
jgi:phage baseplate assembly protein gpV